MVWEHTLIMTTFRSRPLPESRLGLGSDLVRIGDFRLDGEVDALLFGGDVEDTRFGEEVEGDVEAEEAEEKESNRCGKIRTIVPHSRLPNRGRDSCTVTR